MRNEQGKCGHNQEPRTGHTCPTHLPIETLKDCCFCAKNAAEMFQEDENYSQKKDWSDVRGNHALRDVQSTCKSSTIVSESTSTSSRALTGFSRSSSAIYVLYSGRNLL